MRLASVLLSAVSALQLAQLPARAADETVRLELNAIETAENRCRLTFVIENKSAQNFDSFKLDFAMFNTEGAVYRRIIFDMAPVRATKTIVKTYAIDGDCAQLGALLVNDVTACVPGEPAACLDGLALSSRVKNVRLYK
jgi:hypothetical protein